MCIFLVRLELRFLCSGLFLLCSIWANAQTRIQFIENKNQWPREIDFVSVVPGGKMAVGGGSFRYFFVDHGKLDALHHQSHEPDAASHDDAQAGGHAVFVQFQGANVQASSAGISASEEYYNYFLGSDPSKWAARVHGYDGVFYESLYQGIDLKLYSLQENIKYDLIVAPDADPGNIQMVYQGADQIWLDDGDLHVRTSLGEIVEKKPFAWQIIDGRKVEVACAYSLEGNVVSFLFPDGFENCHELVIDPLLIFSTYSGSTADNWGSTATPGERGNLYSAGVTEQSAGGTFPVTPGAYQTSTGGLYDIGILKYDSVGSKLLFATYVGGANSESPHSLVMNEAGELLMLGTTSSLNFPTTEGAYNRSFSGGDNTAHVVQYSSGSDIVISRFSPDGTRLLSSTYFGGSENDGLNPTGGLLTRNYGDQLRGDIITDPDGNVYISSVTSSPNVFTSGSAIQGTYQGGETDAILVKFDPALSRVLWGTYLGGVSSDAAHTLKLNQEREVFVAGGTASHNFPVTSGSYQGAFGGEVDGWIAKISADGSSILHGTYTGTPQYNQIYFLDINEDQEVYVYGQTSGSFPITPGVYSNPGSGQFIQKFSTDLQHLIFSTVFGAGRGIPDISPTAFLVNDCNNLYMSGWGGVVNTVNGYWSAGNGSTTGLTTTPDAFQSTTSGSDFYFIVLTDDAQERLYATFLGGSQSRTHVDGGTSRFDKGGIVYHSVCSGCAAFNATSPAQPTSDFPTTPGAWSRLNRSNNCNNAAFKFDLSSLKARLQTNSDRRDAPGLRVVCLPDPVGFENFSTGGEYFEWDFGDGTTLTTTDTAFIIHDYEEPGQYLVTLKAIDQGTCQVVDQTATTVTINHAQSQVQEDADICFGDSYNLKASGAIKYFWFTSDSRFSSYEQSPVVAPRDTSTYYITLEEANGCIQKDTVTLNVVPGITPQFEWHRLPECVARPQIAVRSLTDSLKSGDSFFFDFGDGTVTDQPQAQHGFDEDGVYQIRLVTTREFCVYEESVPIPVFEMFVPNIITPGQQGHNDVFTIRYGAVEGVTPRDYDLKVTLTILNRWGREIYHTDNYQYDWSGEGLSSGIYYYHVTVEGHATCKSWLQLVK